MRDKIRLRLLGIVFVGFMVSFGYGGDMSIFEAVQRDSMSDVREAIKNGTDVNAVDDNGLSPLVYAIEQNNIDMVELLIDSSADVNLISSNFTQNPLFVAINTGNMDMVRLLLDRGAKANKKDLAGITPLMMASSSPSLDMLKFVLKNVDNDINAQDDFGMTALMFAIPYPKNVSLLIESGADVNAVDYEGNTALMMAAVDDSDKLAKILLDAGIDKYATNKEGLTALDIAKKNKASKVTALLLDSQPDDTINPNDIFLDVILSGDYAYFKKFIEEFDVDVNLCNDVSHNTPLMMASTIGEFQMVKDLIALGADVNAQNNFGQTPLIIASYEGYVEIVALLIESGADVNAAGVNGWSALMYAAASNQAGSQLDIAKLLIESGAKKDMVNDEGLNALDIAKESDAFGVANYLESLK